MTVDFMGSGNSQSNMKSGTLEEPSTYPLLPESFHVTIKTFSSVLEISYLKYLLIQYKPKPILDNRKKHSGPVNTIITNLHQITVV